MCTTETSWCTRYRVYARFFILIFQKNKTKKLTKTHTVCVCVCACVCVCVLFYADDEMKNRAYTWYSVHHVVFCFFFVFFCEKRQGCVCVCVCVCFFFVLRFQFANEKTGVHPVQRTPCTAYTLYSVHPVQRTPYATQTTTTTKKQGFFAAFLFSFSMARFALHRQHRLRHCTGEALRASPRWGRKCRHHSSPAGHG